MRYLIKFSYDGTKFHGFQRQKNNKNVQGTLEKVLSEYFKCYIVIKGAGRTDAGVHAYGQCAHFDVDKIVTKNDIDIINDILSNEINIISFKKVKDGFHARYSVKYKKYIYMVNCGHFDKNKIGYYYQIKYKLDLIAMKKAAKLFEGTHNFHNFVSGYRDNYISTIFKVKIKVKKNILIMEFKGLAFYRYMVRHLVGALIDVGRGKSNIKEIESMIKYPSIIKNLSVVPSDGLYLKKIKY